MQTAIPCLCIAEPQKVTRAALSRTARLHMRGEVMVSSAVLEREVA